MTTLQNKTEDPIAHLSAEDIASIGKELDTIRQGVMDSRGDADAAYIRRVIDVQRKLELGSRAVLLLSKFPPAWVLSSGSGGQWSMSQAPAAALMQVWTRTPSPGAAVVISPVRRSRTAPSRSGSTQP